MTKIISLLILSCMVGNVYAGQDDRNDDKWKIHRKDSPMYKAKDKKNATVELSPLVQSPDLNHLPAPQKERTPLICTAIGGRLAVLRGPVIRTPSEQDALVASLSTMSVDEK